MWVWILGLPLLFGDGGWNVWCMIEAVCGWERVPRFTLEDVKFVWIRFLDAGLAFITLGVGSA